MPGPTSSAQPAFHGRPSCYHHKKQDRAELATRALSAGVLRQGRVGTEAREEDVEGDERCDTDRVLMSGTG